MSGYISDVTDEYVVIHGFTAQEQVDSLREAVGMTPGDMGRWKGGDRLLIDGKRHPTDKAIEWARAHGRTYEVCRSELHRLHG